MGTIAAIVLHPRDDIIMCIYTVGSVIGGLTSVRMTIECPYFITSL